MYLLILTVFNHKHIGIPKFFSLCRSRGFPFSTTPVRSECAKFYSNLKEKKSVSPI